MPRVSVNPISEGIKKDVEVSFPLLLSGISDTREIDEFFSDFLTSEEEKMLGKRLMLYIFLEKGFSVSRIQSLLGVSFETVRNHRSSYLKFDENSKERIRKLARKLL